MMMKNTEFWNAMEEYKKMFGEYFPTEECYASESEMIELMREAIESGIKYKSNVPPYCFS